jgi:hypothetical protein
MSDEEEGPRTHYSPYYCGVHEARLEAIMADVKEIKKTFASVVKDQEKRIQRLERWRSALVATIGLVSSYLGLDRLFHLRPP